MPMMMRLILFCLACLVFPATSFADDAQTVNRLIQLVDYVGVDYRQAVEEGQVVSAEEYAEMVEFAATIERFVARLEPSPDALSLKQQAARLRDLIEKKAPAEQIALLTGAMRAAIIGSYDLAVTPGRVPDLARGAALYQENCASCHGRRGDGAGPLAVGLDPAPTDFRDPSRYAERSLYGLFNTITYGIEGTAMGDFSSLSQADRWSLAAYVGQLATAGDAAARGQKLWQQLKRSGVPVTVHNFTTLTPNEAAAAWDGGADLVAYLRRTPEVLFATQDSPLVFAQERLRESWEAYRDGQVKRAYDLALTAYLEGFELAEAQLSALDSTLMKQVEAAMAHYRSSLRKQAPAAEIEDHYKTLWRLLQTARERLEETDGLSPVAAFTAGFVILLREGLEALLVVIALSAFLLKTGRRDAMPYLHMGWISALVLGALTWFVSDHVVQISGATREVTEGVAALSASVMLLFVGYWLHNKTSAAGWQRFIRDSVKKALNGRTLWGLAGLSFISVYREVFETILFYQALWAQAGASDTQSSANSVMAGFAVALVLLLVVAWLVMKYSVRLPLRQFFGATGALLLLLSFIFAGKGIAALQEAGKIPETLAQIPAIEWLGIFPTWEGLGLQAAILALALLVYVKNLNGGFWKSHT